MRTVALGEVAEINPRSNSISESEIVSFVGMAQLDAEAAIARPLELRRFTEVSKGYTVFRDGDVLAAKITPCWENGKIGKARLDKQIGVGSTEFHVIRSRTGLDDRYLLHFLRQGSVRLSGELRMTGSAGQRRVPASFLSQLRVPLPPLDEQRRIAAILDRADAIRTKRRQVLAHLDTLAQSIFYDMFGTNSSSQLLGEIVREIRYGTSNKSSDHGNPVLGIPNVVRGALDTSNLKLVPTTQSEQHKLRLIDGDLLVVRTNGNPDYVGRCAVFHGADVQDTDFDPSRFVYASYLIRVRPDLSKIGSVFLSCYLATPEGRRAMRARARTSAGQYNVSAEGLRSLPIPDAPLDRQHEFAARVNRINTHRATVQRALAADDELFASLQTRAFRGNL